MRRALRQTDFQMRRVLVLIVFAGGFLLLLGRALEMQVLEKHFFKRQGDARHLRTVEIPAHRGDIYDRHGEPLAISTPVDTVWLNPQDVEPDKLAVLCKTLSMDCGVLKNRVRGATAKEFLYVRRHIEPELGNSVKQLKLKGVYVNREYKRYYPAGEVSAHVLGFTDIDDQGQEGIELAYDKWLTGTPGKKRILRDRFGTAVEDIEGIASPEPGKNLYLSIDKSLQYMAYRHLKAAVKKHHAISGSVVMLDVTTGEVLAMVNQPSFNPNDRTQLRPGVSRNRAVTDVFEPGSTMKPFTIAAALATGRWHPSDNVKVAPGYYRVQGNLIKDSRNYGKLDLGGIILKSSNVGVSKVALSLTPEHQLDMYSKFGFGALTGSGFPGEQSGDLRTHNVSEFERATMSFGYSISVTALQLARAYAIIGSGGINYPASFVRLNQESQGTRVISTKISQQLIEMMKHVVSAQGTAERAEIRNYKVAGKTGTVRKFISGGYAEDRHIALFAGLAPASRPRVAMVVMINEPRDGKYFGGLVAAPVFAKIMSETLRILNVAPDDLKLVNSKHSGYQA